MGREQRVSKGMLVGAEVAPQSPAPFDFAWSKTDANSLSYGDGGTACSKTGLMEGVCVCVDVWQWFWWGKMMAILFFFCSLVSFLEAVKAGYF